MNVGVSGNYNPNINVGVSGGYDAGYNNNMNAGYNNNMNAGVSAGYGGGVGYQGNVGYSQPQMNVGYSTPHVNVGMNPNMGMGYGNQGGVVILNQGMGMDMRPYVCGRPVPKIDPCSAIAVLILNIFFPGFGTMICGCIPHEGSMNCMGDCCCFFWLGYAHCLLWPILVGWILGIVLGCQLIAVAAMPYEGYPTTIIVKG